MKLSQDEENQLVERIRQNPELARCLLEMTDIIGKDLERIDLADDADFKSASYICFDEACLLSAILCYPKTLSPLTPNNYVYSKASFAFKKGISAAKQHKTGVPLLNGKYGLQ